MTERVQVGGLQIAKVLYDFVEKEALPGTGVDVDTVWTGADKGVAAWAHAVDIDGAKPHYHRVATELYYVLEGEGSIVLDGEEHPISKGSLVHIPPGVVHGAKGRMRILVVGIPDLCDDDLFFPDAESNCDP